MDQHAKPDSRPDGPAVPGRLRRRPHHIPRIPDDPWLARCARFFAEGGAGVPFFFVLSGFVLTVANLGRLVRSDPGHGRRLPGRPRRPHLPTSLAHAGLAAVWLSIVPLRPVRGPAQEAVGGSPPTPCSSRGSFQTRPITPFTTRCRGRCHANCSSTCCYRWCSWDRSDGPIPRLLGRHRGAFLIPLLLVRPHPAPGPVRVHVAALFAADRPVADVPGRGFLGRLYLLRPPNGRTRIDLSATLAEFGDRRRPVVRRVIALAPRVHWLYRSTAATYRSWPPSSGSLPANWGVLSRWLATRPVVYFGDVSFSVYMVHGMTLRNVDYSRRLCSAGLDRGPQHRLHDRPAASAVCHRWLKCPMRQIGQNGFPDLASTLQSKPSSSSVTATSA